MPLLDVAGKYPAQLLTIILKGKAKEVYTSFIGKGICITGKLILYKGKPEIIVKDTAVIKIQN